jgi:hypothetical protein
MFIYLFPLHCIKVGKFGKTKKMKTNMTGDLF